MPHMDNGFAAELARFGPRSAHPPVGLAEARRYCGRLARGHYENFTVASVLLPRQLLPHFHAVYAYCRWADDLADEVHDPAQALDLLQWWRGELLGCYDGQPSHPVMVALRETIRRFAIPPEPFLDLLIAFAQDQRVKHYRTFDQLLGYCRNSANPVGRLVLYLGETFDEAKAGYSDAICTALQLTNFWQDVARDFALGRVYLPEEDRHRFGYTEADLEGRRFTPAFAELLRFEVRRTRDLFLRGQPLVGLVPGPLRLEVDLFVRGGLAVLGKIERAGYNVWARRPFLAKGEKAKLLVGAVRRRYFSFQNRNPKPETRNPKPETRSKQVLRSYTYCEDLSRREAANFFHAFRLLPTDQRRAMCALYSFLRIADDLADGPGPVAEKREAVVGWRRQLHQALGGDYHHPLHAALHHAVERFGMPVACLEAVLDGVAMDLEPVRFNTFADLYLYCYRVASAVGLSCIHIWGFEEEKAKVHAEAAGVAFQLTNILRDLGEDAARGRLYLPREDLERFGCDEARLLAGERDGPFRELMRFETARARSYYEAAEPLAPLLPPAGRVVFLVMLQTYRSLLDVMARRDYDVFSRRVRLGRLHKLWLVARALPLRWGLA